MSALLHACLCTRCRQYPQRPEEGSRYPGTGVTDEWAIKWVLAIEPRFSGKAASFFFFFKTQSHLSRMSKLSLTGSITKNLIPFYPQYFALQGQLWQLPYLITYFYAFFISYFSFFFLLLFYVCMSMDIHVPQCACEV